MNLLSMNPLMPLTSLATKSIIFFYGHPPTCCFVVYSIDSPDNFDHARVVAMASKTSITATSSTEVAAVSVAAAVVVAEAIGDAVAVAVQHDQ